MQRVVVTGLGPVTSIGIGAQAFLEGQHQARSGIRTITRFDASDLSVRIAGEVDVDVEAYIDRKEARRLDRYVHFTLIGSALALADAGLSEEEIRGDATGTSIGSGIGGFATWEAASQVRFERGAMRMSPFFIPMLIANMASSHVAMRYGLTGPSNTIVTACATGAGAIIDAFRTIQRGEADVMLTGGSEACLTPMGIGGFAVMRALSTRNDEPETASRPFTASRDGFVAGEGAGILVLEAYEHAVARGARIYAEIAGGATSADAHHVTAPAPGGAGAVRCIRWALRDARMDPSEVGYVNAHGTSTPANDLNETLAFKTVWGSAADCPPVSSTKSMTGHLLGAAGGLEAGITALAIKHQVLPPTVNLDEPDPRCDLDYVPNQARPAAIEYALSNSFGFGGTNGALLFRRHDGD
jgi:3-oxoacyl-[acyl-carrier-protein] synthase II